MTRPNPFARPGESAQKTGGRFERFWSKLLGTEPTRGSGNQWVAPMDVADGKILWNLKYSSKGVLRFSTYTMKALMREVIDHTKGDPDVIPGVATHGEDGETFVTLMASDFLRLVQRGDFKYVVATKAEQKRQRAKIPVLLRDEDSG